MAPQAPAIKFSFQASGKRQEEGKEENLPLSFNLFHLWVIG